jgi:cytoskeletal protein CcmA (bactofilin family)
MRFTDRIQGIGGRASAPAGAGEPLHAPAGALPNAPGQAWIEERTRVAVTRNVNVSGRLIFQEPVRIEGRFRGEISSSELIVISEEGSVDGRVKTPRVLILGELQGDIVGSKSVVLGPRARVRANIEADSLTVCEGARLDGDVRVVAPSESNKTDLENQ